MFKKILPSLFLLSLSLVILFISLVWVSWEAAIQSPNIESQNSHLVSFEIRKPDGAIDIGWYRFPLVKVLPGSYLYSLKNLRDAWWLFLSRRVEDQARIRLLLADKKFAESYQLWQLGLNSTAGKSCQLAFKYLAEAQLIIPRLPADSDLSKQIQSKLAKVQFAYHQIMNNNNQPCQPEELKNGD